MEKGYSGVQRQFGVFFKHPLGTEERRYLPLFRTFSRWLEGEGAAK